MAPPLSISCFFPCSAQRFAEGSPLELRDDAPPIAEWRVKKVRYVGDPIDRMCEAIRLHAGSDHIEGGVANSIWDRLPGVSSWARVDIVRAGKARASAKTVAPAAAHDAVVCPGPRLAPPRGPCAPLLFVMRPISNASLAASAIAEANRTILLSRVRRFENHWLSRSSATLQQRQQPGGNLPANGSIAACSEPGGVEPPRVFTAVGLRAALATGTCSRACAAVRMRKRLQMQPGLMKPGDPWPCLVKDAHPHCRANAESVLVIVSRWQAHLSYLLLQPFCYLVVEKSESPYARQQGVDYVVPNRANEASSYLRFMAQHYDDALPDRMIFIQDERVSKHNKDMLSLLINLHLDAANYMPLNAVHLPFLHPKAFCHVRSCIEQSGLLRRLGVDVAPAHHMDLAYTCCAQFLVSKAAVQAHPRALYEELYKYTLGGGDFGQRGDSFARGECIEVLWHVLFGRPKVAGPTNAAIKCGRHRLLYPRCRETSGLENGFVPTNDSFWSWASPAWQQLSESQRAKVRAGGASGALFGAAVRSGQLCLKPNSDGACETSTDDASIAGAVELMERGSVRVGVRSLGGAERALSTNCSVLAHQDVVSTRRRKFARTLRQACVVSGGGALAAAGGASGSPLGRMASLRARGRRGRGRAPLHQLALCALFDQHPAATGAFLRDLKTASVHPGGAGGNRDSIEIV